MREGIPGILLCKIESASMIINFTVIVLKKFSVDTLCFKSLQHAVKFQPQTQQKSLQLGSNRFLWHFSHPSKKILLCFLFLTINIPSTSHHSSVG